MSLYKAKLLLVAPVQLCQALSKEVPSSSTSTANSEVAKDPRSWIGHQLRRAQESRCSCEHDSQGPWIIESLLRLSLDQQINRFAAGHACSCTILVGVV